MGNLYDKGTNNLGEILSKILFAGHRIVENFHGFHVLLEPSKKIL